MEQPSGYWNGCSQCAILTNGTQFNNVPLLWMAPQKCSINRKNVPFPCGWHRKNVPVATRKTLPGVGYSLLKTFLIKTI
jgi:hypothetical protein